MLDTFEEMDTRRLRQVIRRVRNRWRLRVVLRGAAVFLLASFIALLMLSFALDALRYRPWALFTFSALTYVGLLGLLLHYLVFPLTRRIDDGRIALYIEEHEPALQAEILSAVELASEAAGTSRPERSEAFARRTIEAAVEHCHGIDFGRRVESGNLRRFGTVLAATAAAVMLGVILSPAFLRTGASLLLMPWSGIAFANPYAIDVMPGDAQVAKGADQMVNASLVGFDSDRVEVALKRGGGEWERWPMTAEEDGAWSFLIFDLEERTQYFVEASGVRSPAFRIEVTEVPYVQQLDIELHFPAYSGLAPQTIEDGGDIAALRDTEARLTVTPTVAVPAGRIVFEPDAGEAADAEPQVYDLTAGADGAFVASFPIERDGVYRVELQGFNGSMATASPDYFVEVLSDLPPSVRFDTPGRDITVSPIDETFVELVAEDDFGVRRLELVYTVNGGEEQTLVLYDAAGDTGLREELSAGHTFYLEEQELIPGDFLAYYARAYDNNAGGRNATTTDIYFMEVRPFDRDFRQAQQGGGGAGGGGRGQQDAAFADRQKQIVAATFKLMRDRDVTDPAQWQSDLTTMAMMQGRLREQVELVLGRTAQRGAMQPGSDFQKMAEYLRSAVDEMGPAEEQLAGFRPEEALPLEQRALQFLQRAEALIREAQVQFGGGGGGGGGGNQSVNEELADLLDLEMEKLRNQYETVQRGQQQQVDNEVDEALERLEELARRQQQELERSRRLANLPRNMSSAGGAGASQRQLAEQAEELARRLERLSRENSQPELMETARRLQEAADAMRRSAAGANDSALAEGLNALNRLQQARNQLDENRSRRLARDMEDARRQLDQMRAAQEKIAEEVTDLGRGGASDPQSAAERMQRVMERKDELAAQAASLEEQIDEMARESRRDQREASRKLQDTASWMRDSKLSDKIRYSKGVAQQRLGGYAEQFEQQISQDFERLDGMLEEAAASIGQSEQDRLSSAVDETGDLVRGLESLEERLRQRAGLAPGQQDPQGQQQGRQGEQQGQRGEQQGQEGQRGQQQGQQGQRGEQQSQQGQRGQQGQGQEGQRRLDPSQAGGQRTGGGDRRDGEAALGNWSRGPGGFPPDVARQFRREFDQRLREAEALRDTMTEQGLQASDLDEIIGAMRALQFDGTPRGIDELRSDVIEDLKLFQYVLRRLADAETGRRPLLSGSDEVPDAYRAMVEEYFRVLSRERGRQ